MCLYKLQYVLLNWQLHLSASVQRGRGGVRRARGRRTLVLVSDGGLAFVVLALSEAIPGSFDINAEEEAEGAHVPNSEFGS
jgi:hypothetical protein